MFTMEEINLICIYNTGSRKGLIQELGEMTGYLSEDESELKALAESVIDKLRTMTDEAYQLLTVEFIPDYGEMEV